MNSYKQKLIRALYNSGAIKFGSFKLKSGLVSPFYVDLRGVISYPEIIKLIVDMLEQETQHCKYDLITGIPYTALPMASVLAARLNKPLIYQRKEAKAYGTGKLIEGHFKNEDVCLVIDDVMTTGESKIEVAEAFAAAGINVKNFVIVVDRSFDGKKFLAQHNFNLIALLTMPEIVDYLIVEKCLTSEQKQAVETFLSRPAESAKVSLTSVLESTANLQSQKLLQLMLRKKSNLVLSLDVDNSKDFFQILENVADEIVMVKTHVDIINDFDDAFVKRLKRLAADKDFMVFEDRKFADIGHTVKHQFRDGIYHIAEWADFITVHALPGEGILQGLFSDDVNCSALLLSSMSAKGNLIDDNYTRRTIEMGEKYRENVSGFIGFANSQEELIKLKKKIPADMLLFMPGVNLASKEDKMGQQYVTVEQAVAGGADLIIVGRGIITAENPHVTAREYRRIGWQTLIDNERI